MGAAVYWTSGGVGARRRDGMEEVGTASIGTAHFTVNFLRDRTPRQRVLAMRRVFRRYQDHLGAVMLAAEVPPAG